MIQEMEARQKSFQENIAQLTEKLENERENLLREMNMMLEHKLKVSQAVALVVLDGHYLRKGSVKFTARPWRKHHCHLLLLIH